MTTSSKRSKSEMELWLAKLFAAAYSDITAKTWEAYVAEKEADSADAFLTNQKESIPLQITLATDAIRKRGDALEKKFKDLLRKQLFPSMLSEKMLVIHLGETIPDNKIESYANFITEIVTQHHGELIDDLLSGDSAREEDFPLVQSISIKPFQNYPELYIMPLIVKDVLDPKETILSAVKAKAEQQYANAKDIWLIVVADLPAHTLDALDEYEVRNIASPFAKIWFLYADSQEHAQIRQIS